jgi:hypothetical protein
MDVHCIIYDNNSAIVKTINYNAPTYTQGDFTGSLDNDETRGYGPETITLDTLPEGYSFKIYVHNFSNDEDTANSNATVNIYQGNGLLAEYNISDVTNPEFASDRWWEIAIFNNNTLNPSLAYTAAPSLTP